MCGIVGCIGNYPVLEDVVKGLVALQHRGIQSSGAVIYNSKQDEFNLVRREQGSAQDVFANLNPKGVRGNVGIGHNRYATSGDDLTKDAQPLFTQKMGLVMAHNGQIANYLALKEKLKEEKNYCFFTNCDAEPLLFALTQNLIDLRPYKIKSTEKFVKDKLFPALQRTLDFNQNFHAIGAYSVVTIIPGRGLLAFKDPHGIRPLNFAKRVEDDKVQYAFASETSAFHMMGGFHDFYELSDGEAVFIDFDFNVYKDKVHPLGEKHCIFEIPYFSQVDSDYRGEQVYDYREKLGLALAEQYSHMKDQVDIIVPVPKSPIPAALALAKAWDKDYGGIVARPSHSNIRAFQQEKKRRGNAIDQKHLFVKSQIKDKVVGLVDDTALRGDTAKRVVKKMYDLGAREVHFFVTYPPFRSVCPGGIDIARKSELIINYGIPEEIEDARKYIGSKSLNYLSLKRTVKAQNLTLDNVCLGCTQQQYPFDMTDYQRFQELRSRHRGD